MMLIPFWAVENKPHVLAVIPPLVRLDLPPILLLKVKFVEMLTTLKDGRKPTVNLPMFAKVVLLLRHVIKFMQDSHALFQSLKVND